MKNKLILKHVSSTSKTLMILLIMLLVIAMSQGIIIAISHVIMMSRTRASQQACQEPVEDELTRIKRSEKHFMLDGTVHQMELVKDDFQRDDKKQKIRIYDVNDSLVWQGLKKEIPYQYLFWPEQLIRNWSWYDSYTFDERQMHNMLTVTPELSQSIEFPVRQNYEIKIIWRYIPDKEYFVAYNTQGGITGYLSTAGFTQQKSDTKGFGQFRLFTAWCPEDSINPVMLWQTDKKIYQIDFQKQTVELIFESEKEIVDNMSLKNWRFSDRENLDGIKYRPAILCRTRNGDQNLIMRQPEQVFTFSPPEVWDLKEQSIRLTATESEIYLLRSFRGPRVPGKCMNSDELFRQWRNQLLKKPRDRWIELYTIDEKGELYFISRYEWIEPPYKTIYTEQSVVDNVKYFVTDFSPPFYNILRQGLHKYWPNGIAGSENESIFKLCVALIQELRPRHIIINCSISFVLVLIALWHGLSRRDNWAVMIVWLAIVAVFNMAGFLTYWALNHRPVIKCPACGKKRGLAPERCVRCGAELPVPETREVDRVLIVPATAE